MIRLFWLWYKDHLGGCNLKQVSFESSLSQKRQRLGMYMQPLTEVRMVISCYFKAKGLLHLRVSTVTATMSPTLKETGGARVVSVTRAALRTCCGGLGSIDFL